MTSKRLHERLAQLCNVNGPSGTFLSMCSMLPAGFQDDGSQPELL